MGNHPHGGRGEPVGLYTILQRRARLRPRKRTVWSNCRSQAVWVQASTHVRSRSLRLGVHIQFSTFHTEVVTDRADRSYPTLLMVPTPLMVKITSIGPAGWAGTWWQRHQHQAAVFTVYLARRQIYICPRTGYAAACYISLHGHWSLLSQENKVETTAVRAAFLYQMV